MDPVLFYKNLADDTRLKILLLILAEKELCVCELTQALALSQPKVSRHLAQLRKHQLLTVRKSGKWAFYSLSCAIESWQFKTLTICYEQHAPYLAQAYQQLSLLGDNSIRAAKCCE